jgi:hypothetical protein
MNAVARSNVEINSLKFIETVDCAALHRFVLPEKQTEPQSMK